jgi:hypothetical protein
MDRLSLPSLSTLVLVQHFVATFFNGAVYFSWC